MTQKKPNNDIFPTKSFYELTCDLYEFYQSIPIDWETGEFKELKEEEK